MINANVHIWEIKKIPPYRFKRFILSQFEYCTRFMSFEICETTCNTALPLLLLPLPSSIIMLARCKNVVLCCRSLCGLQKSRWQAPHQFLGSFGGFRGLSWPLHLSKASRFCSRRGCPTISEFFWPPHSILVVFVLREFRPWCWWCHRKWWNPAKW